MLFLLVVMQDLQQKSSLLTPSFCVFAEEEERYVADGRRLLVVFIVGRLSACVAARETSLSQFFVTVDSLSVGTPCARSMLPQNHARLSP